MKFNPGKALATVLGGIVGIVSIVIVVGLIFAYFIMLLWNACLVPAINGVNEIGFLQAWGLMIMCSLLFARATPTKS